MAKKKKNIPQKFNIINLIIAIIALLTSIYSIYSNESIAKRSGSFDKGRLSLSLGNYDIIDNKEYEIYYGLSFSEDTINLAALPLIIHNRGEKSVEDVELINKYPYQSNILVDEQFYDIKNLFKNLKRTTLNEPPSSEITLKIDAVNPKSSIKGYDILNLSEETAIKLNTKKREKLKPTNLLDSIINLYDKIRYSSSIPIHLSGKDIIANNYNLTLNTREGTNLNNILRSVLMDKYGITDNEDFFIVIPKTPKILKENNLNIKRYYTEDIYYFRFSNDRKHIFIMNPQLRISKPYNVEDILRKKDSIKYY